MGAWLSCGPISDRTHIGGPTAPARGQQGGDRQGQRVEIDYATLEALQAREQRLADAQRLAHIGSWEWDIDSNRVTWSDELYRILGLEVGESEATYQGLLDRVHPADRDALSVTVKAALEAGKAFEQFHRVTTHSGEVRWIQSLGDVVLDGAGRTLRVFGTARDVTREKEVQDAVDAAERCMRSVMRTATDAIVVADHRNMILGWNKGAEATFGLLEEEAVGSPVTLLIPPRYREAHLSGMARLLRTGERRILGRSVELVGLRKDGTEFPIDINLDLWTSSDGPCFTAVIRDVTERKEAERRLTHERLHDPLTGLPNRALFEERARRAVERARRQEWSTALIAVDIDHFTQINDRLGNQAGDHVLVEVARRLESVLRPQDSSSRPFETVARLGGDVFFLLCENVPGVEGADALAASVSALFDAPFSTGSGSTAVTAGVGVTVVDPGAPDVGQAVLEAEAALRRAKQRGTGAVGFFVEQMRAQERELAGLERDLSEGIAGGQFRLHYQPKILLSTDRITSVEALVRWEHPSRGLIAPDDFIPLAERTGLIVPLGAWVLEEAGRQTQEWQRLAPDRPRLEVAVNVSASQFESGLVTLVAQVLERTRIDPACICLEVTESIVMENVDYAIEILESLKALGVSISIDDFGTGYSSLAYLKRFPLDELKIDRSFVDGLGRDPEDTAIVATVIAMAHALDLRVVAEGVETAEQLERLRNLGCEQAQGYYFSRPVPPADVLDLLAAENEARARQGPLGPAPASYQGETVVIADDSPEVLQLARASLTTAGFTVHEAHNGREALTLAAALEPDCVILDVRMPVMGGFETCRALRADPVLADCTVVMLTANAEPEDKVEGFSSGADDYIVKPFAPRDLVSRVRAAMRRREEHRAPNGPPAG